MFGPKFFFGHNSAAGAAETTVTPGVGLVQTVGQIPNEYRELQQAVGVGLAATVGQVPIVTGFVFPGVGLAITEGRVSSLGAIRLIEPGVGSIVGVGQIPGEYRELNQGIGLGLVSIGGVAPACLPENGIGPGAGLCAMGGLTPSLYLERLIEPGVGEAILEGRLPTVTGDSGTPVVEATALPDVGYVSLSGQTPDLAVEYDKPRGHVTVKRRRGRRNYGEQLSDTAAPVLSTVPPETLKAPVIVDPPREAIAALDTSQAEAQITTLETRRSRLARMRREEEELIAILMRAA